MRSHSVAWAIPNLSQHPVDRTDEVVLRDRLSETYATRRDGPAVARVGSQKDEGQGMRLVGMTKKLRRLVRRHRQEVGVEHLK